MRRLCSTCRVRPFEHLFVPELFVCLILCVFFVPDYHFMQALLEYEKHKMGAGELTEPTRVNNQVI
jgi:hypothetical protein